MKNVFQYPITSTARAVFYKSPPIGDPVPVYIPPPVLEPITNIPPVVDAGVCGPLTMAGIERSVTSGEGNRKIKVTVVSIVFKPEISTETRSFYDITYHVEMWGLDGGVVVATFPTEPGEGYPATWSHYFGWSATTYAAGYPFWTPGFLEFTDTAQCEFNADVTEFEVWCDALSDSLPEQSIMVPLETDYGTVDGTLAGSVSDDGLPEDGTLTYSWSQVSGPTPVTIFDPASLTSNVRFFAPGTYVLRLTASDGVASSHDDVTIVVTTVSVD